MAHGGKRSGAGRKSKAEEQNLVEKLSPLAPKAFKALDDALQDGQSWAVKMFMEYTYGKPKETVHNTHEFSNSLNNISELYANWPAD